REPLTDIRYREGNVARAADPSLNDTRWKRIGAGDTWGEKPDTMAWLRIPIRIPGSMAGMPVCVRLASAGFADGGFGAEALAYIDGKPRQGLDRSHGRILLKQKAKGGERCLLTIEAFTGVHAGGHTISVADIEAIDEPTEALFWDARVAIDAVKVMDPDSVEKRRVLDALHEMVGILDLTFEEEQFGKQDAWMSIFRLPLFKGSDAFYDSVRPAARFLRRELDGLRVSSGGPKVLMTGHAHIDVAWLWRLSHSRKKCGRTFSSVLEYMKRFPKYHFFQSQPALYQFTKEDYPELYRGIKRRVREGRWEANGATWVEMDTNLPNGESLVRQFLYGKRFFQREFGTDARVLWLPDVFGYSWALPQIMKKSGVDYFMTTKTSWNQYNDIPSDIFTWRGIDGSEVLTCFIVTGDPNQPIHTYNGMVNPATVKSAWQNFKGKRHTDEVMLAFGHGDGGGGPDPQMLENAARLEDFPGVPSATMGNIQDYFDRLAARATAAPVWNGELYFELHRGTYTTQARTKKNNRLCENALHNTEWLASMAWLDGMPYPTRPLNACWESVLTHQFHDIIPGSSIPEVYEDADRYYGEVLSATGKMSREALKRLTAKMALPRRSMVILNGLGWERNGVLDIPRTAGALVDGENRCAQQDVMDLDGQERTLVEVQKIPSMGYKAFPLGRAQGSRPATSLNVGRQTIENRFFKVRLDKRGEIRSILDKRSRREVVADGEHANRLLLFEDRPLANDAWDVDIFYNEKCRVIDELQSIKVSERGPLRGGVEIARRFGRSRIRQRILLYDSVPRIDFETEVDWQQRHELLKVAFPVAIHSDHATYEIQFGAIRRPTHWNTSWDWARFEVCGHRWADLSEGDYGVSLLNDSKYGHDIKDNVMRLTLLRSTSMPDPHADSGQQRFTYSLFPHAGDWASAGTPRMAAELNSPMLAVREKAHAGRLPPEWSLVQVDRDDVVVDTVKKAEDRNELVVRLYENANRRGRVTLTFGRDVESVRELDLMEAPGRTLRPRGRKVSLQIKPFEIRTLGVRLGSSFPST
ncbi:MAG: alpha-mannosidase, partial [Lentisphaerae bacterium]|nr:alpha-mannosidase [Lentisphaerota bacterium]